MGRISVARSFASSSEVGLIQASHSNLSQGKDVPCSFSKCQHTPTEGQEVPLPVHECRPLKTNLQVEASQQNYSIASRHIPDENLPFVPAEEVAKRNGKEGANLCWSRHGLLSHNTDGW